MKSSYLDHLPAAFRQKDFAGEFLLAFEALFSGLPDAGAPGLQERIDDVPRHLDPVTAPADFLPWLAGWVALAVPADWDTGTVRGFIREIVPLYAKRGTVEGITRMLEIFLRPLGSEVAGDDVSIADDFDGVPHYFQVRIVLPDNDPVRIRVVRETARTIVEREKPAHTVFGLKVVVPTMRLVSEDLLAELRKTNPAAEMLVLGRNTSLGSAG